MVARGDIGGTGPVAPPAAIRLTASLGDAQQEAASRFSKFPAKALLQGQVMSRLQDGSFMVKVADTPVRVHLPPGSRVGDTLQLTLLATQPRLTFSLPVSNGGGANTSLSEAARLIGEALRTVHNQGGATALIGRTPVVASPAATPAQLAAALKNTITLSGLFYESHLHQWATGNRSLSEIMREPQARQGNRTPTDVSSRSSRDGIPGNGARTGHLLSSSTGAGMGRIGSIDANPLLPATPLPGDASDMLPASRVNPGGAPLVPEEMTAPGSRTTAQPSDGKAAPLAAPGHNPLEQVTDPDRPAQATRGDAAGALTDTKTITHVEPADIETARMISLQLDTLEQRHVAWQGELWPGQPMEWEVTEESPKSEIEAEDAAWHSAVRFELPTLGVVSASIRLTGDRLQVHVRAGDEDTTGLLRARADMLTHALEAAGSALELLTVKHDNTV